MSPPQPSRVDPKIWQCCAGASVKIPKLHSHVYYFPLGHLEHVCPSPNPNILSLLNRSRPIIPCYISAVDLLADPHTDEVFVKLLLTPVTKDNVHEPQEVREHQDDGNEVVSSAKTLTQSDANNGGAFSVPRECAKLIFPPLDLKTEKPSQELSITDIHGEVWKLRHVYRGTPLRHLITTGWSKFVDKKKFVSGDSLVFMKTSEGSIFVGFRRHKSGAAAKLTEKSFTEAAELAEKNMAFEVMYYPRGEGWRNFVVDAKLVEEAMKINWNPGMRIKLSLKNDDSSKRCSPFQGTISALSAPTRPWRMLQVNWDEPKVSQLPERVSPWEVELISNIHAPHLPSPPTKKHRTAQDSTLFTNIAANYSIPNIEFQSSAMRSIKQTLLNNDAFRDGMQGARHNLTFTSSTSNFLNGKSNGIIGNNSMAVLNNVSTEQNTSSVRPIKLFGKIIYPNGSHLENSDMKGDDDSKGSNKNDGADQTMPQK